MSLSERSEGNRRERVEPVNITIPLTEADYSELTSLVRSEANRNRGEDWDGVFNVGMRGEIFPYTTSGHTRREDRTDLRGVLPLLDRVAAAAVEARGEPGRFFVKKGGVFYKIKGSPDPIRCVQFDISSPPRQRRR